MIVVQVFISILNQTEIHLVKENCHLDHIPFNLKGNGNIVFSQCASNTGPVGDALELLPGLFGGPSLSASGATLCDPVIGFYLIMFNKHTLEF